MRFTKAIVVCFVLGQGLEAGYEGGEAVSPAERIALFDDQTGSDLRQFYSWLADHGYEDPKRVFSVVDQIDGAPAIRVSGEHWGGLVTRRAYKDYRLVVEYRWGSATWGHRKARARNSGILLHCTGEDGNYRPTFKAPWIASIEYEIMEGRTGDIILVGGYVRNTEERILPRISMAAQPGERYWDPAGIVREFVSGEGHLHWFGKDRAWKNELGFRGPRDIELPAGQWNKAEAIVAGGDVAYFLNGVKVMEATKGSLTEGRILFQSEGAEIFFRKIVLLPLPETHAEKAERG